MTVKTVQTVQIVPAENWYFRHDGVADHPPAVYPIAAWALQSDGNTVGLVARCSTGTHKPILIPPPDYPGEYLHREQLNEVELKSLTSRFL